MTLGEADGSPGGCISLKPQGYCILSAELFERPHLHAIGLKAQADVCYYRYVPNKSNQKATVLLFPSRLRCVQGYSRDNMKCLVRAHLHAIGLNAQADVCH